MLSDAYVEASCDGDGCRQVENVPLTATAGRGWDERNVAAYLTRIGWLVNGDNHYCEDCKKKHQ